MGNIAVGFNGKEIHYLYKDGQLERWLVGATVGMLLGRVPVYYPILGDPLVWSSDSTRLVLSTEPFSAITVWDVATGRLIAARQEGTYPVAIDDSLLAYRGPDEQLILWDPMNCKIHFVVALKISQNIRKSLDLTPRLWPLC